MLIFGQNSREMFIRKKNKKTHARIKQNKIKQDKTKDEKNLSG